MIARHFFIELDFGEPLVVELVFVCLLIFFRRRRAVGKLGDPIGGVTGDAERFELIG